MDLLALSRVDLMNAFQEPYIASDLDGSAQSLRVGSPFQSLFDSAVNLVKTTNDYSNAAEEEEMKFAMGETESIHDLQIAQQKANIALQYTVAVRDSFMSGYKELMNLQF